MHIHFGTDHTAARFSLATVGFALDVVEGTRVMFDYGRVDKSDELLAKGVGQSTFAAHPW